MTTSRHGAGCEPNRHGAIASIKDEGPRATRRPQGAARNICSRVIDRYGGRYSVELGIRLAPNRPQQAFRWFLAALLFGAPIRAPTAAAAYRALVTAGIDSPRAVIATDWGDLVSLLDQGGYARYDYKTATKLQKVCAVISARYRGSLNALHAAAASSADLETALQALGSGVGPVTTGIFLREMRGVWPKARPLPSDTVVNAAHHLGLVPGHVTDRAAVLQSIRRLWNAHPAPGRTFADFETALARAGMDLKHRLRIAHRGDGKTVRPNPSIS